MSKFIIRNKISSLLKTNAKPPIVEIEFLGSGGAFDTEEKNSSLLIKTGTGTILIDCGFTVYSELFKRKEIENINYIFISHCHEDHIGSLSTLIYHKFFVSKQDVKIECEENLKESLHKYLIDVCGHPQNSFVINQKKRNSGDVYDDLNMRIFKIDTTDYHYKDMPTAGFVFHFKKSGEDVFIVFSGDINVPFTDIIAQKNEVLYKKMVAKPENVFMFHEATAREYPPYFPHCEFKKLIKTAETFPNIYTYHHSKEETKTIIGEYQEQKRRLNLVFSKIDSELSKKIGQLKTEEAKENLRIQAQNKKEMFKEQFSDVNSSAVIFDVNQTGLSLVIQEEMGL